MVTKSNNMNRCLLLFCLLVSAVNFSTGKSIELSEREPNVAVVERDSKVYQNATTSGFVISNSTNTAVMMASGSPAGVINSGGTSTSFTGSVTISQDVPSNTSFGVGGSLSANCGGGQLGTFIAGQHHIGLHSNGNCSSFVDPNINRPFPHVPSQTT